MVARALLILATRHLTERPIRTGITIVGITLGVAFANESVADDDTMILNGVLLQKDVDYVIEDGAVRLLLPLLDGDSFMGVSGYRGGSVIHDVEVVP